MKNKTVKMIIRAIFCLLLLTVVILALLGLQHLLKNSQEKKNPIVGFADVLRNKTSWVIIISEFLKSFRGVSTYMGIFLAEALLGEVICESRWDYLNLLPEDLPEPFTTKTLAKAMRRSQTQAQCAANVLYSMGVLERVGQEKNAYLYVKKQEE